MVPIHWQERVYQDLERDVKLGVLVKVSPNTTVTWCSRMVVTAKSDGSPRRTVDLQPQNKHCQTDTLRPKPIPPCCQRPTENQKDSKRHMAWASLCAYKT